MKRDGMSGHTMRPVLIIVNMFAFTARDYQRFGIKSYLETGFEVKFWDITQAIDRLPPAPSWQPGKEQGFELIRFTDKASVREAVNALHEQCIVMTHFFYDLKTLWLFRALSHSRAHFGLMSTNALPGLPKDTGNKLKHLARKSLGLLTAPMRGLAFAFRKMPPALFGVHSAHFVVLGGSRSSASVDRMIGPNTHRIWSHSLDYDLYLRTLSAPVRETQTIVFLDENEPFHPDYDRLGIKRGVTAEKYYPALCRFFAQIEQETSCQVVIAVHPSADYETGPDYFQGRPLIRGRTEELVKESKFVLAHMSTAINYAVLYEKQVVLILTDEMFTSGYHLPLMEVRAEWLGKRPVRIESPEEVQRWQEELSIDKVRYRKFTESYIKTADAPVEFSWQILARAFQRKPWMVGTSPKQIGIESKVKPSL